MVNATAIVHVSHYRRVNRDDRWRLCSFISLLIIQFLFNITPSNNNNIVVHAQSVNSNSPSKVAFGIDFTHGDPSLSELYCYREFSLVQNITYPVYIMENMLVSNLKLANITSIDSSVFTWIQAYADGMSWDMDRLIEQIFQTKMKYISIYSPSTNITMEVMNTTNSTSNNFNRRQLLRGPKQHRELQIVKCTSYCTTMKLSQLRIMGCVDECFRRDRSLSLVEEGQVEEQVEEVEYNSRHLQFSDKELAEQMKAFEKLKEELAKREAKILEDKLKVETKINEELMKAEVKLKEELMKADLKKREELMKADAKMKEELMKVEEKLKDELAKEEKKIQEEKEKLEKKIAEEKTKALKYKEEKDIFGSYRNILSSRGNITVSVFYDAVRMNILPTNPCRDVLLNMTYSLFDLFIERL